MLNAEAFLHQHIVDSTGASRSNTLQQQTGQRFLLLINSVYYTLVFFRCKMTILWEHDDIHLLVNKKESLLGCKLPSSGDVSLLRVYLHFLVIKWRVKQEAAIQTMKEVESFWEKASFPIRSFFSMREEARRPRVIMGSLEEQGAKE